MQTTVGQPSELTVASCLARVGVSGSRGTLGVRCAAAGLTGTDGTVADGGGSSPGWSCVMRRVHLLPRRREAESLPAHVSEHTPNTLPYSAREKFPSSSSQAASVWTASLPWPVAPCENITREKLRTYAGFASAITVICVCLTNTPWFGGHEK